MKHRSVQPYLICFYLVMFSLGLNAQMLSGSVSFVTSQNVYLKFENTETVSPNDTVFLNINNQKTPCLKIIQKSSISCVAEIIGDCPIVKGTEVFVKTKNKKNEKPEKQNKNTKISEGNKDSLDLNDTITTSNLLENINGRISLANYNSNDGINSNNRTAGRFYLKADNLLDSKLNFTTYANYNSVRKKINSNVTNSSRLSIFQFDLTYEGDSGLSISLGRRINNKFASLGAVDGLQVEKKFNKWFVGGLAGFRPNPFNYSFNGNLFQGGFYGGIYHNTQKTSHTTIGFANQQNGGNTDRRYLFLQHQSNINSKLSLFTMAEADVYSQTITGTASNSPQLTSAYTSLTYRITKKLNVTASIDARKNLILYQSYAENLPNLISNNPTRMGYRARVNYQLAKFIYTGVSFNQRLQSNNNNSFSNISAYATLANIFRGRFSLQFTQNQNDFFIYQSYGARYTNYLLKKSLEISPYFRFLQYKYPNSDAAGINQLYAGMDVHYNITKKFSVGGLYEFSKRSTTTINRINLNAILRF